MSAHGQAMGGPPLDHCPLMPTYGAPSLQLVRGEGSWVWDDQGNKYLDCFGGVLTVSVGHAEPRVNKAWIDQVNTISHTSTLYANKPQGDLAEKLAEISPGNLKKSFFTSSGTAWSSQRTKLCWKSGVMCWTIRIGAEYCRAKRPGEISASREAALPIYCEP